jgi:UDP-N-acetylmuramoyl-tripeptide--D-alanyl-D-alanine ligase
VLYGLGDAAEVRAEDVADAGLDGVRFTAVVAGERVPVSLRLLGRHNVHNALAAIAVGVRSGMSLAKCAAAVGELRATEKRGLVVEWRGVRIVNDCYNSNPAALDAMVDALMAMPVGDGGRRIVVAGEMLELGGSGAELHRACGLRMRSAGVDQVVGVRGLAREFGGVFFESPKEAGEWMVRELKTGDVVLLKASRGVRLEQALECLAGEEGKGSEVRS